MPRGPPGARHGGRPRLSAAIVKDALPTMDRLLSLAAQAQPDAPAPPADMAAYAAPLPRAADFGAPPPLRAADFGTPPLPRAADFGEWGAAQPGADYGALSDIEAGPPATRGGGGVVVEPAAARRSPTQHLLLYVLIAAACAAAAYLIAKSAGLSGTLSAYIKRFTGGPAAAEAEAPPAPTKGGRTPKHKKSKKAAKPKKAKKSARSETLAGGFTLPAAAPRDGGVADDGTGVFPPGGAVAADAADAADAVGADPLFLPL